MKPVGLYGRIRRSKQPRFCDPRVSPEISPQNKNTIKCEAQGRGQDPHAKRKVTPSQRDGGVPSRVACATVTERPLITRPSGDGALLPQGRLIADDRSLLSFLSRAGSKRVFFFFNPTPTATVAWSGHCLLPINSVAIAFVSQCRMSRKLPYHNRLFIFPVCSGKGLSLCVSLSVSLPCTKRVLPNHEQGLSMISRPHIEITQLHPIRRLRIIRYTLLQIKLPRL